VTSRRIRWALVVSSSALLGTATSIVGCGLSPLETGFQEGAGGGDGGGGEAAPRPCSGPIEICGDGVDNDCNGLKDCDDPVCESTHVCVTIAEGWEVAARIAEGDAGVFAGSCPDGWGSRRELVVGPHGGSPDCTCECGQASSNPCLRNQTDVFFRTGAVSCNDATHQMSIDGSCHPLEFAWSGLYNGAGASTPPPRQVSCPASAALPPIVDDGYVVICSLPPAAAASCAGGTACVERPGAASLCVIRDGDHACPLGYPAKLLVGDRNDIVDQRTCGTCTCMSATAACSAATVRFFGTVDCTGASRDVTLDGNCNAISGSGTPTNYLYEATPDTLSCAPVEAVVPAAGSVSLSFVRTLCCAP
jgi:hypothetical protein